VSAAPEEAPSSRAYTGRFVAAVVGVGLIAGVAGILLTGLLRAVQHLAYDVPVDAALFIAGALSAPPWRRVGITTLCGLAAGLGWWALERLVRPRIGIERALQRDDERMPLLPTTLHAILQIVTSGLGSPLGREVAPREVGAAFGAWVSRCVGLSHTDARLLLACGAGAGLGGVYNVPIAGALFTLEVVLRKRSLRAVTAAAATSIIATLVARLGIGDVRQYVVPPFEAVASLLVWAAVAGPLLGIAAEAFRYATRRARRREQGRHARQAAWCVAAFAAIGVVAAFVPGILGNGQAPAQAAFNGVVDDAGAALVLALKMLAVMLALRVGAYGGLLTPSIACGALVATLLGSAWSIVWPGPAAGAYALIGASAFLGAAAAMPVTAVALLCELTGVAPVAIVPMAIAAAGAQWARWIIARRWPAAMAGP
jgi:H+/Cl- antiporter ClcA